MKPLDAAARQAEGVKLIEGRMFEHVVSPNCSSAAHGCWNAGSALRPPRANDFDIALLAQRLEDAVRFLEHETAASGLRLGFFGASAGAAAALVAAARLGDRIGAVVSRGGRPDLAGQALEHVRAPTRRSRAGGFPESAGRLPR